VRILLSNSSILFIFTAKKSLEKVADFPKSHLKKWQIFQKVI